MTRLLALFAALTALLFLPSVVHAAPPPSKERRVLSKVHTDAVSVFYELGALTLGTRADVDGEHGKRLDPRLTLFNVEDAARLTIPDLPEYSFLGAPGDSVWIAPQTNPEGGLLWPGFNTEGVASGVLDRNELTFELEKVSGPGRVDLYEVGGFGNVVRILTDRGDAFRSWTRPVGQHIHANWAFSAPGRYVLRFKVRAAIGGAPVSTTQEYVFHVGDVPALVPTATTLTSSASEVLAGRDVTLTASVHGTGWVEFLDGSTSLGWTAVTDGRAALTTSALALGAHDVTARFTPEWTNDFAGSVSTATRVTVVPDTQTGVLRIDGSPSYTTGETMRLRAAGVTPAAGQTLRWWYVTDGDTHLYPLFTGGFVLAEGPEFALELSAAVDEYSFVVQLLGADGAVLQQSAAFDARVSGPSVGSGLPVAVDGFKARYEPGEYAELTARGELPAGHRFRWVARSPLFPVTVLGEERALRVLAASYASSELFVQILDAAGAVVGRSPYVTVDAAAYRMTIEREPRDFYRAGETLELTAALTPDNGRFTRYEWLQYRPGDSAYKPIAGAIGRTLRLPLVEADHNSSIYVRLLSDDGKEVAAQSATIKLDVVPATGQTFYLRALSGHYHSGGTIRLTAIADPLPAGATFRWFFKRADEDAFRTLAITAAAHTMRASQALDGAQVYAQMLAADGTVLGETDKATIAVDDHGTGPNEAIAIGGLAAEYRPGERATLNAIVTPGVDLDRYEWWVMRRGQAATRVEGVTGPAFAFDADVGLDGATVQVNLVKNTGEVYIQSAPVTLAVAERRPARVGGTVPSVLALALGPASDLGTFVPGTAREYTASVAAEVTTTLRGVALTVHDPATTAPGRLVNGEAALAQPLQVAAGDAFAPLPTNGSTLRITTFTQSLSAEPLTIAFKQAIGAREALDVGEYGKTLTFTLAPGTP